MSIPEWRFEVTAVVRSTGKRHVVGRANDRGGANVLVASAKAQGTYRDVRLHDLKEQTMEEDFL